MKFGSVCSGIEAASVAWQTLGWKASWFSEIEPFPCAVLKHHYPDVPNLGDMSSLPERIISGEVDAPDLFCGGTPCQAFSVAGLRRSLDDARGNLSLTFCEIANAIDHVRSVRSIDPSIIFWENVPGVLNTKDNAFGCFLGALAGEDEPLEPAGEKWTNAGCVYGPQRAVAWRVLDAQYFGVAQRRRRVFVIASARKDFDPAKVLFEFDGMRRDTPPSRKKGENPSPTIAGCANGGGANGPGRDVDSAESLQVIQPYKVGNTLTARMHKGMNSTLDEGQTPILHPVGVPDVMATLLSSTAGISRPGNSVTEHITYIPMAAQPTYAIQGSMIGRNENAGPQGGGVNEEVCFTQKTIDRHAVAHAGAIGWDEELNASVEQSGALLRGGQGGRHDGVMTSAMTVRRLTPVECERLQGFPENYTDIKPKSKPTPDGLRYKALGNSWAVPVIRWIGKRISEQLQ